MKKDNNLNTTVRLIDDEIASKTSICFDCCRNWKGDEEKKLKIEIIISSPTLFYFCSSTCDEENWSVEAHFLCPSRSDHQEGMVQICYHGRSARNTGPEGDVKTDTCETRQIQRQTISTRHKIERNSQSK